MVLSLMVQAISILIHGISWPSYGVKRLYSRHCWHSMYEAYNNSYPTMYGNVLHMKVRVLLVRESCLLAGVVRAVTCASFHSLTKR